MTDFDNILGSLARGGPGGVRYDGDSLTNDEEHQYRIDLAALLEQETELIKFPDNVGSGATIAAAEEAINELRGLLLNTADGLRTIGEAAKKAAPAIRAGTAADPEVQAALRESSAAYASVKDLVPPGDDDGDGWDGINAHGGHKSPSTISPETDHPPAQEASPSTRVSAAAPDMPAAQPSAATAPASAAPAGVAMPVAGAGAPMAGGPVPAGSPMATPSGLNPGGGVGGGGGPQSKPSRHRSTEPEPGPVTYGSSSTGPEVDGVMPIVNPSVIGGRVDPAQISGRTVSTSTSAAAESPLRMGPAGSVGQMGGMGGAPLGGGGIPGGGAGRPNVTQPRRDRASERILSGEEARDKALISHILRDDDPVVAGEFVDAADVLADMLPDDRHPAPQPPHQVTEPVLREPIPENRLREPIPPTKPPAPQYPGEPADDELW